MKAILSLPVERPLVPAAIWLRGAGDWFGQKPVRHASAALLLRFNARGLPPNKSFKPMPLRGTA